MTCRLRKGSWVPAPVSAHLTPSSSVARIRAPRSSDWLSVPLRQRETVIDRGRWLTDTGSDTGSGGSTGRTWGPARGQCLGVSLSPRAPPLPLLALRSGGLLVVQDGEPRSVRLLLDVVPTHPAQIPPARPQGGRGGGTAEPRVEFFPPPGAIHDGHAVARTVRAHARGRPRSRRRSGGPLD